MIRAYKVPVRASRGLLVATLLLLAAAAQADISRFVGAYEGSAEVLSPDGTSQERDMNVEIEETRGGFIVNWTSTTIRPDGERRAKSYSIAFAPSSRGEGVFEAEMKRNVFGHSVQLDPMRGEPYVWSRIVGDTLSVFSLYVAEDGGYEIQQFDRTLAPGGLDLDYRSVRDGEIGRTVSTFLSKQ